MRYSHASCDFEGSCDILRGDFESTESLVTIQLAPSRTLSNSLRGSALKFRFTALQPALHLKLQVEVQTCTTLQAPENLTDCDRRLNCRFCCTFQDCMMDI